MRQQDCVHSFTHQTVLDYTLLGAGQDVADSKTRTIIVTAARAVGAFTMC